MRYLLLAVTLLAPATAAAQHVHTPGMTHEATPATSRAEAGQGAFAAISEIVASLSADPKTDWAKVNIEALRQHLIDMDEVTLRAAVRSEPIPGGARFKVSGTTRRTVAAIRRMTGAHAPTLERELGFRASVEQTADGATLTVTGSSSDVPRIRALGFVGLLTLGDHHAAHHLMIARGEAGHDH